MAGLVTHSFTPCARILASKYFMYLTTFVEAGVPCISFGHLERGLNG